MSLPYANKRKIFNDPVYGFITIPSDIIFHLIEHPYFQRLRRIKQLGLTHLVYPGALHTRFHHSMGAMYLMQQAIETLRAKGNEINDDECNNLGIAILLHDIGHGPYSHTLEHSIVANINHEQLSELFMNKLNGEYKGDLSLAIEIFKNDYHKTFLNQLISSQLDMDRLDYLKRDSFYTGVSEGVINADRIIKMLDVSYDELVVEAKGIYSIEKFIIARRLMYWQVYLHKTVVAAEYVLRKILLRAKYLIQNGEKLFTTPALGIFLSHDYNIDDFKSDESLLKWFSQLDDFDIFTSIKVWIEHNDKVLSHLSSSLVNRKLPKVEFQNEEISISRYEEFLKLSSKHFDISEAEASYLVFKDSTSNYAFDPGEGSINIIYKDHSVLDISKASDQLNISVLSKPVSKHFLCYPKELYLPY